MRLSSDSLRKQLNIPITNSLGTAESSITVSLGKTIHNQGVHLNPGAGLNNIENLFRIYGAVRIRDLRACVCTMTDTTVFDNVQFTAVSAGGNSDITLLTAAGARAISLGTMLSRTDVSTVALKVDDPAAGVVVSDPVLSVIFAPFNMIEETAGVASYIAIEYDADAATDLIIDAHCTWSPLSDGGLVEVV